MATSTDLDAAIDAVQYSLAQEEAPEGEAEEAVVAAPGFLAALQDRLGVLPWWVISLIVHAILILLFVTFFTAERLLTAVADDLFVASEFTEPEEEEEIDMEKPRDLFKSLVDAPAEAEIEQPVLPHDDPDAEVSDHFETDNDMDMATARGDENALSTVPLGGTGVIGTIGVGGGGAAGVYGFRNGGGRRKCIMRYGGSRATESAVEAALKWLSDHQEADGSWDAAKYDSHQSNTRIRVGTTGLALLAFLGAGYTANSKKYGDNVRRAQTWLMSQQKPNGGIFERERGGSGVSAGYNHAVASLALAEAYGMTKDEKLREVAQKAVDYSVNIHQVQYSGWRYDPKEAGDLSVTGWFVMQLKSAKVAGLVVDGRGFQGAMNFVESVTREEDGRAGYQRGNRYCPAMTSVGMVCRQFMGAKNTEPILQKGGKYLLENLPEWPAPSGSGQGDKGFYYWYYGALGMFQQGGESWKGWNQVMKKVLVENQCTKEHGDNNGSWDPHSWIDKYGGRVYTTALGALCLEVYYRYLPMYKD